MSSRKQPNLEKSLADLEALVEELESGELPLEIAMQKFEEGIRLTRGCQAALREAEQRVQILLQSTGEEDVLEEFIAEEDTAPFRDEYDDDDDDDQDDDRA